MRRGLILGLVFLLLVGAAGVTRLRLEAAGEKRLPASLLYLPKGPFLRAMAVGHEEVLADLLYIWSIQYYSTYDEKARYDYLDQVFRGAITELDPRFTEVYLVGALIMTLEAGRRDMAMQLYDKGLEKMPDNWEIAYWAGWECYNARDFRGAREYWARAAAMPEAPHQLTRLAAKMLEKAGDETAAITEYRRILESTTDEHTRKVVQGWIDRAWTEKGLRVLREGIERYRNARGHCPPELESLVRAGFLRALPLTPSGKPFYYEAPNCQVLPAPGQTVGVTR